MSSWNNFFVSYSIKISLYCANNCEDKLKYSGMISLVFLFQSVTH